MNEYRRIIHKKNVITWTMTMVLLVLGYFSYQDLPRLEDPEFAIKDAVIVTPYPGRLTRRGGKRGHRKDRKGRPGNGPAQTGGVLLSRGLSTVKVNQG